MQFNDEYFMREALREAQKAFDAEHKRKLLFNIGKYNATVVQGKKQYADLEHVRKKVKKWCLTN